MFRPALTILLACFSFFSFSQSENSGVIDSLNQIVNNSANEVEKAQALVLLSDEYSLSNIDTMIVLCNRALDIVAKSPLADDDIEKFGLRRIESEAYNNLGYVNLRKGNLEEAKIYLIKSGEIGKETGHYENNISVGINLSLVYAEQGDFRTAIEILEKTQVLADSNHKLDNLATILNNIGWIYQTLHEYEVALSYYYRAYQLHEKIGQENSKGAALNNLGVVYSRIGNLDSAEYYYEQSFDIRKNADNPIGMANSYANLAGVYAAQGDTIKAINYYKSCLDLSRKNDLKRQWVNTLNAYGKLVISQKDLKTATNIMIEFDTVIPKYSNPNSLLYYYQFSYQYHELKGDLVQAYNDYKHYHIIKDSSQLTTAKYEVIGRELKIQNDAEKKLLKLDFEHQIEISKEKEKRQRLNFYIVGIVLLSVVILLVFVWIYYRQRQKLTRMDLELSKIKNEKLEEDVTRQNKELTAYTLRVAQNNQFLQNIDEVISNLNSSSKEAIEDQLRQLKVEANINKRRDKDWVEFQKQFEGIHTSFIKNLTTKYPELSTGEIRLCTLIKLNLTSKDIASVLGVSMNTLKSSRYRIHKKIGLEKGQELADFILRFE